MSRWSDIWDRRINNGKDDFSLRKSPLIVGFILGGFTVLAVMFLVDMAWRLLFL